MDALVSITPPNFGGRIGMSNETSTGIRSNFASRLLHKAMSDRKTTGENPKIVPAEANRLAGETVGSESKQPVLTASSAKRIEYYFLFIEGPPTWRSFLLFAFGII